MDSDRIKAIQTFLNTQGYDLVVDGFDGKKTREAFDEFFLKVKPSTPVLSSISSKMVFQGSKRYPLQEMMIHCTATRSDWMFNNTIDQQVAELTKWHQARGWKTIGYHYVINRRGEIGKGRSLSVIGAGCEGHNAGVAHVSLVGGHGSASTDPFPRNYTEKQMEALKKVYQEITSFTQINTISGHNQYANKACPGFEVDKKFIEELKR